MLFFCSRTLLGKPRELAPLEEWIESGEREAALEPELPMVDPHHHLWDPRTQDKGWPISEFTIKVLYQLHPNLLTKLMTVTQDPRIVKTFSKFIPQTIPYMETQLLRDIQNQSQDPGTSLPPLPCHNIVATVYMECGWQDPDPTAAKASKAVPEVTMAQGVATKTVNRVCTGIVGHVPLVQPAEDIRKAFLKMKEQNNNFRGIRDELAYKEGLYPLETSNADKAYNANFRAGLKVVEELHLTYDTWLYADNIPAFQDLALAFPNLTMILDHCGIPVGLPPSSPTQALESWKIVIQELATNCPNVNVKLSGLGMAALGFGFETRTTPPSSVDLANAWRPIILHCINCFGVDRCMFASNFPVDKISGGYTQLFNAFKLIVKDYSATDKQKLFHDTAVRIYKLRVGGKE